MQAVAFWTIIAEHCCIFEKLCKSLSVPKTNKMWVGRAHEVSVCKERKNKSQTNQKENTLLKCLPLIVCLKEEYILKRKTSFQRN